MKIAMEPKPENWDYWADAISLDRLLTILEAYKKGFDVKQPSMRASLNQWISYLTNFSNGVIKAHTECRTPPLTLHLPFEEEFSKFLKEAEKENGTIRGSNSR